jgi:hypothetical protein
MHPGILDKNTQQMQAYREMNMADLFDHQWVRFNLGSEDFPSYKGERTICAEREEGINFERHVVRDGRAFCCACTGERYDTPL